MRVLSVSHLMIIFVLADASVLKELNEAVYVTIFMFGYF